MFSVQWKELGFIISSVFVYILIKRLVNLTTYAYVSPKWLAFALALVFSCVVTKIITKIINEYDLFNYPVFNCVVYDLTNLVDKYFPSFIFNGPWFPPTDSSSDFYNKITSMLESRAMRGALKKRLTMQLL